MAEASDATYEPARKQFQKLQAADWNQIFRAVGPSESELPDNENARRRLDEFDGSAWPT